MSPEMIAGTGHGFMMDIYSLGVLLFEFLTGLPPFYSENKDKLADRILYKTL